MKRAQALLLLMVITLLAVPTLAVEVRLRDGQVIEAESYILTGSYLMITMATGARVAYDVADVDLDALRAAEAAAAAAVEAPAEESVQPDLVGNRSLAIPPEEAEPSGITITDQDVRRFRPEAEDGGEGGEDGSAPSGPPEGYEQGGGVVLSNLRVSSLGEGRWLVEGDVVNRSPNPVTNVRVQLQTVATAGGSPWNAELSVTNSLPPDEVAVFSREFQAAPPEGKAHPDIKASVYWMASGPAKPVQPPAGRVPGPLGPVPTPEL